jgi:hypothetical protein
MVSLADLTEQARALRKALFDLFDQQGWTVRRCALVENLDEVLAKLADSGMS